MSRWRMPPQIERLALVALAIAVAYFTARHFLVPPSFGKYGWYRADALKDYAALPIAYAGAATCLECHDEVAAKMAKERHRSIPCQSCHGPLNAHAEDASVTVAKITDPRYCVRCHEANPSRPEKHPQVVSATHYETLPCTECHSSHRPQEAP